AAASNTHINGPDVVLRPEAGQVLAMVFHELATNVAKYGANSASSAAASVRWRFWRKTSAESWLRILCEESGDPAAVPPARSGYGDSVVREQVPYELGRGVSPERPPYSGSGPMSA